VDRLVASEPACDRGAGGRGHMALDLNDSELAQKLRDFGVDVGPITNTTREVYYKKYRSLVAKFGSPNQSSEQQSSRCFNHPAQVGEGAAPLAQEAPPPSVNFAAGAEAVVEQLLHSFDNPTHLSSDTAFVFPGGEVIMASRSVLASQCTEMAPMLFNTEGIQPRPARPVTCVFSLWLTVLRACHVPLSKF